MDLEIFVNQFAGALPSVIFFWAIAYFIIIKRNKFKVRTPVALAYFMAPVAILAFLAWPIRSASYSSGISLLVPLLLSVTSCALLYFHERAHQKEAP